MKTRNILRGLKKNYIFSKEKIWFVKNINLFLTKIDSCKIVLLKNLKFNYIKEITDNIPLFAEILKKKTS